MYKYQNVKFKIAKCKKFEIAFEKYWAFWSKPFKKYLKYLLDLIKLSFSWHIRENKWENKMILTIRKWICFHYEISMECRMFSSGCFTEKILMMDIYENNLTNNIFYRLLNRYFHHMTNISQNFMIDEFLLWLWHCSISFDLEEQTGKFKLHSQKAKQNESGQYWLLLT